MTVLSQNRTELVKTLSRNIDNLREAYCSKEIYKKALNENVQDLIKSMEDFENYHDRQMRDEENKVVKETLISECVQLLVRADKALFPPKPWPDARFTAFANWRGTGDKGKEKLEDRKVKDEDFTERKERLDIKDKVNGSLEEIIKDSFSSPFSFNEFHDDSDTNNQLAAEDEVQEDRDSKTERKPNTRKSLEDETEILQVHHNVDFFECDNDQPAKARPLLSSQLRDKTKINDKKEAVERNSVVED